MSNSPEIKLYWASGPSEPNSSLEATLAPWRESPPVWSWVEPRAGVPEEQIPGPVTEVLLAGMPPTSLELDEARLFWPDRSVHLKYGPAGWSWFAFAEEPVAQCADCQPISALRKKTKLVALRDWSPWPGIRPSLLDEHDKIDVVEYFDPANGQCLQWRVMPPKEEAHARGGKANA